MWHLTVIVYQNNNVHFRRFFFWTVVITHKAKLLHNGPISAPLQNKRQFHSVDVDISPAGPENVKYKRAYIYRYTGCFIQKNSTKF